MGGHITEQTRVLPRQARSRATVDAILEAAALVLEDAGEAGFNTNAVAERAGVGIGSLYRYFPGKRAILVELGRREMAHVGDAMAAALAAPGGTIAPDRAAIRAFLQAFGGKVTARRAVVTALLNHLDPAEVQAALARTENGLTGRADRPASRMQAFMLSRGLLGIMRSAVLEGADFLLAPEFEDELVQLSRAYMSRMAETQRSTA